MPRRIQLKRTKGWRMPPNTVKVDRSTKWGNPFIVGRWVDGKFCVDSAAAVREFRARALSSDFRYFRDEIREKLRGKNLACWCKPGEPCHAEVLLELANK